MITYLSKPALNRRNLNNFLEEDNEEMHNYCLIIIPDCGALLYFSCNFIFFNFFLLLLVHYFQFVQ